MDENSRVLTGEYNSISQALSTLVEQYLDKPHCLAFPNIKTFPQDKVSPETSNDGITMSSPTYYSHLVMLGVVLILCSPKNYTMIFM